MDKNKIVRIAMRITEAIITILKEDLGEKDENRQKKTKTVRKSGGKAVSRVRTGDSN